MRINSILSLCVKSKCQVSVIVRANKEPTRSNLQIKIKIQLIVFLIKFKILNSEKTQDESYLYINVKSIYGKYHILEFYDNYTGY